MSMGHAAGVAAAMAVQNNAACRDVDGAAVRAEMVKQGANLHQPPTGYWQEIREKEGRIEVLANDIAVVMQ